MTERYPANDLPLLLRDQVVSVLRCEAERHVIEDAQRIAEQAADELDCRAVVPPPVAQVMARMSGDWGFPAYDIARDTGLSLADVRAILRALRMFGLASLHKFFNDDDSKVHGSGYSLTARGSRLRDALIERDATLDPVEHVI